MFHPVTFAIMCGIVGLLLIFAGWIRPVGMVLYCGKCNYNLTGNTSGVCPECGQRLSPQTTRFGLRKTNHVIFGCGVVIVVLGLPWTVDGLRYALQQDWYQWYPTFMVLGDLEEEDTRPKAIGEIRRRITAETIREGDLPGVAEKLVELYDMARRGELEQGVVWSANLACEQLAVNGQLPPDVLSKWLDQLDTLTFRFAPITDEPRDGPWTLSAEMNRIFAGMPSGLCRHYLVEVIGVDGEPVHRTVGEAYISNTVSGAGVPLWVPQWPGKPQAATLQFTATWIWMDLSKLQGVARVLWMNRMFAFHYREDREVPDYAYDVFEEIKKYVNQHGVELQSASVRVTVPLQGGSGTYRIDSTTGKAVLLSTEAARAASDSASLDSR